MTPTPHHHGRTTTAGTCVRVRVLVCVGPPQLACAQVFAVFYPGCAAGWSGEDSLLSATLSLEAKNVRMARQMRERQSRVHSTFSVEVQAIHKAVREKVAQRILAAVELDPAVALADAQASTRAHVYSHFATHAFSPTNAKIVLEYCKLTLGTNITSTTVVIPTCSWYSVRSASWT